MSSNGSTTFTKENNPGKGRHHGSRNKQQVVLQQFGLERAMGLLEDHFKSAKGGNESAREFLIKQFVSAVKAGRFVKIKLPKIKILDDILPAQQFVIQHIASGVITIDEGTQLFELIEHQRKTIEMTDLVSMIQKIDKRMNDAGI